MDDKLVLEYGQIMEIARLLQSQAEAMGDSNDQISNAILSLKDYWSASTAIKYEEQYDTVKPYLKNAVEMVLEMSEQLIQIANNFSNLDNDMAGQIS